MRRVLSVLPSVLCALFALGCPESGGQETEIRLRIEAPEPALAAQLSALNVSLYREERSAWTHVSGETIPREKLRWPLDIPIRPRSDQSLDKRFEVVVDAFASDEKIAQARALFSYDVGSRTVLPLSLRSCPSSESGDVCATDECHGQTCNTCALSGTCAPVIPVVPDDDTLPSDDSPDAGKDAGSDASLPEADALVPLDGSQFDATSPEAGAGAAPSQGPRCVSTSELCDGADNDCDGKADNGAGMTCTLGTREACTFSSASCSAQGTRECSSACTFNVCVVPPETQCDHADENCNGSADEGLLQLGAPIVLTTFSGTLLEVQVAVSPFGLLALYATDNSGVGTLQALRIGWNAQAVGTPVTISTGVRKVAGVAWNGSSWSVAYTASPTANGIGSGVFVVELQRDGTLGAPRTLSTGTWIYNVRVAGSKPSIVVWDDAGGVFASSATGAATQSQLIAPTMSLGINRLAFTAVEDGVEWALWVSGVRSTASMTFPLHYLTVDKNLNVKQDVTLSDSNLNISVRELAYMPDSQQLVGLSYLSETGSYALGTHTRDGKSYTSKTDQEGRLAADDKGYVRLGMSGLSRFLPGGALVETHASSATLGTNMGAFGLVRTVVDLTNRYGIVSGASGQLRLIPFGCK